MRARTARAPMRAGQEFERWPQAAKIALIFFAVIIFYLPALRAGFVWDDESLITANPLLRDLSGLGEIWSGSRTADYFPITNTVFWIESQLFGGNAVGYHAFNILLQAANALLVWFVLRRLEIPGAFLAGLIFGIHPAHAESVAWISELKNVLSMFFLLLCSLCFFEIEDRRILRGPVAYGASLFFFLLALLSKTQVVFLPVGLLLCAWWRSWREKDSARRKKAAKARSSRFYRDVVRTVPFFLLALVLGLITIWFQSRGIGEEEIVLGSLSRRLVNAGLAIWFYAKQVFMPIPLMAVYPHWRFDSPDLVEWLPLFGLAAVMTVLWFLRARDGGGSFFAVAYFIVALLPVVGLLRMAYARSGTIVADHLQYFADLSLIALFSAGVARFWMSRQRAIRIATGALVLLLLGAMGSYTWARAKVFRSEETLWQDNFEKNPDAWQGHNRMGELFFKQGKFQEAAKHFARAAELKPELGDNYNWVGLAYCRLERFEEGIVAYRKGLQLKEQKPATAKTKSANTMRINLANALVLAGNKLSDSASPNEARDRYDEAIRQYEKALEIEPEHPAIYRNLGLLFAHLGRTDEAIMHLRKVLQLVPNEPNARAALEELEGHRP